MATPGAPLRVPLLAILGLVVAGGCRSHERREPQTRGGVGFELPGKTSVARGALLTQPPGHEEAFLAFVATSAPSWVDACRREAGVTPPLFTLETDPRGALRPAPSDAGATARDRCLAARAAGTPSPAFPAATRLTVQLALRAP
jgi:hypothetical protein